jgi:hypothetical protein
MPKLETIGVGEARGVTKTNACLSKKRLRFAVTHLSGSDTKKVAEEEGFEPPSEFPR